jgi:predicted nucleic acid-binding protein
VLAEGAISAADVGDCIEDLVAGIEAVSFRGSPPQWLMRAREQLAANAAGTRIDALAGAAGVHRAHFARAFQHWFGIPPSLFRRRTMLNLAIAAVALVDGAALWTLNRQDFSDIPDLRLI